MKKLALLFIFAALSCGIAAGQTSGGLKGKVRDPKGNGLAGAKITVRRESKDLKSAVADSKGNFELSGIEAGNYNLVIEKSGFSAGVLYNVEIKGNKVRDLGDRLVLTVDQGTLVIIKGSVFDTDGRSIGGAKIEIEKVSSDGSTKKVGADNASYSGEFTFRFPEGASKYRVTASAKGISESKEIEVDGAAIYRLAITLKTDK